MLKVEIELSEDEAATLTKACLLRVTKKAVDLLEFYSQDVEDDDVEGNIVDLEALGPVFENVRQKLVSALLRAQAKKEPADFVHLVARPTFIPNMTEQQEPRAWRSGGAKAGPVTIMTAGTVEHRAHKIERVARDLPDEAVAEAMREFERMTPSRLRYGEAQKWHVVDLAAMRRAVAAALVTTGR